MRETLGTILCLGLLALPLAGCGPQEPEEQDVRTEEEFDVDAAEVTPEEEEMQRQQEQQQQEQMQPPPEPPPPPPPEQQPPPEEPPPPPPGSGR